VRDREARRATCPGSPVAWLVFARRRVGAGASARRPESGCCGVPRRPSLPKQVGSRSRSWVQRNAPSSSPSFPFRPIRKGSSGLVSRTRRRDGVPSSAAAVPGARGRQMPTCGCYWAEGVESLAGRLPSVCARGCRSGWGFERITDLLKVFITSKNAPRSVPLGG
jgi:hypothetical protein